MYASKHFSEFKANLEASSQPPPEGPNSGYVVVKEDDTDETCCWGLSCRPRVRDLPFPQNKVLTVYYSTGGENSTTYIEKVVFVPVINLPLSANRYYAVVAKGKHKGQVHTCSLEENMTTCCFCRCIKDVKAKPFDYRDTYQQIEIIPHKGRFTAKSVASDGFPPFIFRQKYWTLYESKSKHYELGDAFGLSNAIRSNFLKQDLAINVVAGKWYCPFIFLKEGDELNDQMERSCYYEVTLEQYWQEIYSGIEKKRILLRGKEIMREERESGDGFVWFIKTKDLNGERIGLSLALWERIKWEEDREGWNEGAHAVVEEVKFGSYVLVERFSFKRLDGSVALALEFIHTDKVRTNRECTIQNRFGE